MKFFPIITFVSQVVGADKTPRLYVGQSFKNSRYSGLARAKAMAHFGVQAVAICQFEDRAAAQRYCDEFNAYQKGA